MAQETGINRLATRFLADLVAGSGDQARARFRAAVRDRSGLRRAYLNVLLPSQLELYRLHASGVLGGISHLVTGTLVCHEIMNEFAGLTFSAPSRGIRTLVVSQSGDVHDLGARMLADLLQMDGFETTFLSGASSDDVAEELGAHPYDLLLVSVASRGRLPEALEVRERARVVRPSARVIIGGRALAGLTVEPPAPRSEAGAILLAMMGFPRRQRSRSVA